MKTNYILQGSVFDRLKDIEDESIQCVVTSPPYWCLRDYGTAEWEGGDENCEHKVGRATRGGLSEMQSGNIGGFGDESIKNGGKCPKCGAIRKDKQLGLEETPEEFVDNLVKMFREIKRVLREDGTVWLNLGDSYFGSSGQGGKTEKQTTNTGSYHSHTRKSNTLKTKDLVGIPWRVAFALQSDGWYLRQDIIWHKPNPMPESVQDRCTKSHEYIFLLTKSAKYFYDADAVREPVSEISLKRAEYGWDCDRPSTKNASMNGKGIHTKKMGNRFVNPDGRNKRSVWTITTKPYKEAHFATFPPELPELCIKAGSREGDIVLDPFFGSGTTGWVAQRLGRKWIGVELNPEYIKIAEKRFMQQELF